MIYLTFVGNHDDLEVSQDIGAACNIFSTYKDSIAKVFIFVSPSTKKANYKNIAVSNKSKMLELKSTVNVELIDLSILNPIDFDLVYPALLDSYLGLESKHNLSGKKKIINITSGTPTMTSCWVLLSKSGIINNSILVQSVERDYRLKDGRTTQEVNFNIDDFPKIKAPDEIKRRLAISERENKQLKSKLLLELLDKALPELIGRTHQILEIKDQIINDINQETHVLIIGERGTGKEVIANAIWKLHHKNIDERLEKFDCGGFSENLIQSELFGHIKGAFTGADKTKEGILKKCNNRMIFLDEIGNLSLEGQSKLLRVLSEGEVRKIGSEVVEKINIQIISATNKDISDNKIFAQDLKDRFDEIIELPSLRERKSDIPVLLEYFINHHSRQANLPTPIILEAELLEILSEDSWPDNIRGLEKWVQRLVRRFKKGGAIGISDLPKNHIQRFQTEAIKDILLPALPLPVSLDNYIDLIITEARKKSNNVMSEVDRLLQQKPGAEKQRQYRKRKS